MSVPVENLVSRLHAKRSGKGWMAHCPAHEDDKPSLSISEGADGRALVKCHAGCPLEAVLSALGMKHRDLFPGKYPQPAKNSSAARAPVRLKLKRPNEQPFDWRACVDAFTQQHLERLAKWRGYSMEFCSWLKESGLVGLYHGFIAFPVHDRAGYAVACHFRLKDGSWLYPIGTKTRPLVVGELVPDDTVHIFESQWDAFAFMDVSGERHGIIVTRGASNGALVADVIPQNAKAYLWTQNDAAGENWQKDICANTRGAMKRAKIPEPHKDLNDWARAGCSDKDLQEAEYQASGETSVDVQPNCDSEPTESDQAIARLAALPPLEYERCRKEEAEKLGCRESVLDKLVEAKRPRNRENNGLQGNAVYLTDVEPWAEPVNGAEVIDAIAESFTRYVVSPDGAADVCALWCALAHVFEVFLCSPRLNVRSAEPECGKTTLRDVVGLFVPRPVLTENLTVAVLFRLVNAQKPVILADEYDAWMRENEEMRSLLNAGHRRGAKVYRCEGDGNEVRAFNAYAPAMLCGIGALPGTLHDRSIVIHLERKKDDEVCSPFDSEKIEHERELSRKLARWCADNRERFVAAKPKLPSGVFNRLADNWRPLFAIAEVAGGDWPKRCADACAKLTRRDYEDAESIRTLLLADIRKNLTGEWPLVAEGEEPIPVERIFSRTLVGQLCTMAERPWPEARRGKPISEQWLAKQLANFRIHPKTLRIGEERAKGYEAGQFSNAFARYLPPERDSSRDAVTYEGKQVFRPVTKTENVTGEKMACTEGNVTCHASKEEVSENESVEAVSDEVDAMPGGILEL